MGGSPTGADAAIRWVSVSAKPEMDEGGNVAGYIGMLVDTTGRKLAAGFPAGQDSVVIPVAGMIGCAT